MTKVMTVVGTRPEIIRLSRVISRLDKTVDHVLAHQNAERLWGGKMGQPQGER